MTRITPRKLDTETLGLGWLLTETKSTVVGITEGKRRGVSRDLFGFVDLIGFPDRAAPWLVQVTDYTHAAARRSKVRCSVIAMHLVRTGAAHVAVVAFRIDPKARTLLDLDCSVSFFQHDENEYSWATKAHRLSVTKLYTAAAEYRSRFPL